MSSFIKNVLKKSELIVKTYDKLKEFYYKYCISDVNLIRKEFKEEVGREVNLEDPVRFNDKLQWLKLNWYDPLATKCADKYEVREIIEDKIGKEYLNELYEVYESVDEIDLNKLPNSFVLKGTHGSGFNIVCKDKNKMDWDIEFRKMRRWLRINYYWQNREWVYRDIKPRIVCEKFLIEDDKCSSLTDYKFFCFSGKPMYCQVIRGRNDNETIDFYDVEWNHMPFTGLRSLPNSDKSYTKPEKYEEMLELAKKLSGRFPFVRVDFYYVKGKIYFGELTFFPLSGFGKFEPEEWDVKIGNLLKLPKPNKL